MIILHILNRGDYMKIAIYSRKSKYTGKGDSIVNQIQMCKDYIETHYINNDLEYIIYEDEGFSGGNINRPRFQKLLSDIKKEKFDILICYRLDRISRNVSDFSTTLEELQSYGVDFISIKEQFDTTTPIGRAMIYIASVFAQLERETIAERVRDNMVELAKSGKWSGGRTPLGFNSESSSYIDEEGNERKLVKLVKNDEELQLVNLIYDTYLREGSLHKTEVYFASHNIKSNKNILLEKTSLKVILSNPVYAISSPELKRWLEDDGWNVYGEPDGKHSYLSYNKTKQVTRKGKTTKISNDKENWIAAISNCPGIIDADKWIAVQEQFKGNRGSFPKKARTHNAKLVGKIYCAHCNNYMQVVHGNIKKDTGKRQFYYSCSLKRKSKSELCKNKNLKVEEVENLLLLELEKLGKNKKSYIQSLKKKNDAVKKNKDVKLKQNEIQKEMYAKQKILNNLVDKLAVADDLDDIIIQRIRSAKNEMQELQKQLDEISKEIEDSNYKKLDLDFIESLLEKCADIRELDSNEQRLLIGVLVDKILWDGNTQDVTVYFIGSGDVKKKSRFSTSRFIPIIANSTIQHVQYLTTLHFPQIPLMHIVDIP